MKKSKHSDIGKDFILQNDLWTSFFFLDASVISFFIVTLVNPPQFL